MIQFFDLITLVFLCLERIVHKLKSFVSTSWFTLSTKYIAEACKDKTHDMLVYRFHTFRALEAFLAE